MNLKIVSNLFIGLIIIWAVLNLLLMLGSSHSLSSIDNDYLVIVFGSLIIFPLTMLFLYKTIDSVNKINISSLVITVCLLALTGLIFCYYLFELWTDEYSDAKSLYEFVPIIVLILDIYLIRSQFKLFNRTN